MCPQKIRKRKRHTKSAKMPVKTRIPPPKTKKKPKAKHLEFDFPIIMKNEHTQSNSFRAYKCQALKNWFWASKNQPNRHKMQLMKWKSVIEKNTNIIIIHIMMSPHANKSSIVEHFRKTPATSMVCYYYSTLKITAQLFAQSNMFLQAKLAVLKESTLIE